jgi:hypothetical protein
LLSAKEDSGDTKAVCRGCLPREADVYSEKLMHYRACERHFHETWQRAQRLSGELHKDINFLPRDSEIYYEVKKRKRTCRKRRRRWRGFRLYLQIFLGHRRPRGQVVGVAVMTVGAEEIADAGVHLRVEQGLHLVESGLRLGAIAHKAGHAALFAVDTDKGLRVVFS